MFIIKRIYRLFLANKQFFYKLEVQTRLNLIKKSYMIQNLKNFII